MRRMAEDRSSWLPLYVDKYAVRDFVKTRAPGLRIPKLYQVADHASELDSALWPEQFVIKPSHGSGALVMVTREEREGLRYAISTNRFSWVEGTWGMRSSELDVPTLKKLAQHWISADYEYFTPKFPEWAYGQVPPKVLVEQLIDGSVAHPMIEARFHCFHGSVRLCRVTNVLSADKKALTLDRAGRVLDAWLESDPIKVVSGFQVPKKWADAIAAAELLANEVDYVRVDLYLTSDHVYFSEMTPYPNGGTVDFVPPELSSFLAEVWVTGSQIQGADELSAFLAR